MEALGARLAAQYPSGIVYLQGELGAGKTTLVRGWLRALGYQGKVKSPTYTLIEPYDLSGRRIYHFDLYRLTDPHELENIGARDYLRPDALCLIEWPERGGSLLPSPDLWIIIEHRREQRRIRLDAMNTMINH
ncbi:MAG: tRNA (adenosine(37)-N6)-threonylcarbamoyltransferase complex ATPase subunit type 1 TsaE [Gammaproteobacteria bacterium]|nr:tRNA (adenosine(37)-N6)-threonylcarbamoyltransferase complex ATPase subunit type 1 TsaE [Gammaproteobacteria bacterium]